MRFNQGDTITFPAFYTNSGQGVTGLTVTAILYKPDGTSTTPAVSEIGSGFYKCSIAGASVDADGLYLVRFATAGAVDQAHLPAVAIVGIGNVIFPAFYTNAGLGVTGLTVTSIVYEPDGTSTTPAVTEVGSGFYKTSITAANIDQTGAWLVRFATTGTVNQKHLPGLAVIGQGYSVIANTAATIATTIRQGIDYTESYVLSSPPSPSPTAVTFTCDKLSFSKAGSYSYPNVVVTLTAAETALFSPGKYACEIRGTVSGLTKLLASGNLTVERDY